jgi:hypothetical protein
MIALVENKGPKFGFHKLHDLMNRIANKLPPVFADTDYITALLKALKVEKNLQSIILRNLKGKPLTMRVA